MGEIEERRKTGLSRREARKGKERLETDPKTILFPGPKRVACPVVLFQGGWMVGTVQYVFSWIERRLMPGELCSRRAPSSYRSSVAPTHDAGVFLHPLLIPFVFVSLRIISPIPLC